MRLILFLILLSGSEVHASSPHDMARFKAMSGAKSLGAFESAKRRFDLLETADLACRREMEMGKVPANCYVVLKAGGRVPISPSQLANSCNGAAKTAVQMPHPELLRLLPDSCVRILREREKLLAYKAGKEIE